MAADRRAKSKRSESKKGEEERGPKWSYRGYELGSGEFTTAMVHLFRAEINRANVWRTRLDSTTNWAIVTTAAAVSFGFSESQGNHIVIMLSALLVTILLYIESRRYRYYELWSSRVRLMETDFFATMLVPPFHPSSDWGEALAENLLQPHYTVSIFEALGRRLRRNYIWIFTVLLLAWLAKLWLHPQPTSFLGEFISRAALGLVPGGLVMIAYLAYFVFLLAFALVTARLQQATGEVLVSFGEEIAQPEHQELRLDEEGKEPKQTAWFRRTRRRKQYLCLIVTDQAEGVSQAVLADMHRGVTALHGTGMYSGREHDVLMCAVTITEVGRLKSIVAGVDPSAFVIVTPAQEVLGRGFLSIED